MPSLPVEDQDQFMGKQSHPTHFADSSKQEITQSIEDTMHHDDDEHPEATRHQQPEVSIPTLIGLVFLFAILCVSIANFVSRKHCADLAPDKKLPQVTVKQ
jgi:hypothetical protein